MGEDKKPKHRSVKLSAAGEVDINFEFHRKAQDDGTSGCSEGDFEYYREREGERGMKDGCIRGNSFPLLPYREVHVYIERECDPLLLDLKARGYPRSIISAAENARSYKK